MYTYQDLLEIDDSDEARMAFTRSVIDDHKQSELYKTAVLANEYDKRQNRTILNYIKFLQNASGKSVRDNYSANYKMPSNFFDFFVTQENQYLLSNGVSWVNESTSEKLGKNFDTELQKLGKKALVEGEAFGFWNYDHLEVFGLTEFAPLYDEENGALMAGVRFWQIDTTKPLRATLYELDGLTQYIWDDKGARIIDGKHAYRRIVTSSVIDGTVIYDGENYPTFPIVPLWGSQKEQSEIVGLRENIDAYDIIKSGFANDLDDVSQIYWILENAGAMDEPELADFVQHIKRTHAAYLMDGVKATANTVEIPYAAREAMLTRLRDDLFEQAQAYDPKKLASGGSVVTAAIKAAYAPLDTKCNEYEYCVAQFLYGILKLVGIEDEAPTFTRSQIINQQEQVNTLIAASEYLPTEYVTKKVLTILGDGDMAEDVLKQMQEQGMNSINPYDDEEENEELEEDEENYEDDEIEGEEEDAEEDYTEEDDDSEDEEDNEDDEELSEDEEDMTDDGEEDEEDSNEDAEIDNILDSFMAEIEEMLKKAEEEADRDDE